MKISSTLYIVILLITAGCRSTPVKLDPADLTRIKQQADCVAILYAPKNELMVITKETAKAEETGRFFGPIGLLVGAANTATSSYELGMQFVQKYSIEDPVIKLKERVVTGLQVQAGVPNIQSIANVELAEDMASLRKNFGMGTVMDFKTTLWGVWFQKEDPSRYNIIYFARMRMINLADSKVIWEGECGGSRKQDSTRAPTMSDLQANNGSLLKSRFDDEAKECAGELMTLLLGN